MKMYCVISHTHWDREWYMPLELMRLRLVDMIDRCLSLLEQEPDYIFYLDAQTVVLEDYLSVRPSARPRLERVIREGRLLVGPWYLQNDFFLTSGEATVRNLQVGRRLTAEYGCTAEPVGYAPDQFGQISQLPQILRGFGIDNFVFGRGVSGRRQNEAGEWIEERHPAEFCWEGPDGSRVLAIFMPFWYNNLQRLSADTDKALRRVQELGDWFDGITVTPYMLLMNGVDHLEAQDDLLSILEKLDPRLGEEATIRQTSLPAYVAAVREDIRANNTPLYVHRGDMRVCEDGSLLKGTLSARIYVKQQNDAMQELLESRLEPLYAMLELAGAKNCWSRDHFEMMWKKLLRTHPHDSICGCSRDEIHDRMEKSYASLERTAGEWLRRGLLIAAEHLPADGAAPTDYRVVMANTLPFPRREVVECTVDLPEAEVSAGLVLLDEQGRTVPFEVLSARPDLRNEFTPLNLPLRFPVEQYVLRFEVSLPAFGFGSYRLTAGNAPLRPLPVRTGVATETVVLENAHLQVTVQPDGRVAMWDKVTGRFLDDLLDWEECADRGDSYLFGPDGGPTLYGHDFPATVEYAGQGTLLQQCRIRRTMRLPARYDFDTRRRSEETVALETALTLTLKPDSPVLEIGYRFVNTAADHRLRLVVHTGIDTARMFCDTPYDVVERQDSAHFPTTVNPVWPNTSFAALEEAGCGFGLLTAGQREVEHLPDQRAMALTLVRSTGVIGRNGDTLEAQGTQWDCPGNQCLRELSGTVGLMPYAGDTRRLLPREARRFRNPVPTIFTPVEPHRFVCGRTAVQAAATEEKFFYPDPYAGLCIPAQQSLLTVEGDGVDVTALKAADAADGMALRMVNLSDRPQTVTVTTDRAVYASDLREEKGELLGRGTVTLELRSREICTVILTE
ncbi:MAG: hypothetical protein IJZ13_07110 [Clostridia bacterium]|nr:hypothetical protein [Clostridia bacterium]